jgi:hypothetical protein
MPQRERQCGDLRRCRMNLLLRGQCMRAAGATIPRLSSCTAGAIRSQRGVGTWNATQLIGDTVQSAFTLSSIGMHSSLLGCGCAHSQDGGGRVGWPRAILIADARLPISTGAAQFIQCLVELWLNCATRHVRYIQYGFACTRGRVASALTSNVQVYVLQLR